MFVPQNNCSTVNCTLLPHIARCTLYVLHCTEVCCTEREGERERMTDITKVVTKTALNVSIEELVFVPQNNCSTVNCTGLVCSILYVHCTLQTTSCTFHITFSHCTLHIVCTAVHWGLLHREREGERERGGGWRKRERESGRGRGR